MGLAGRGWNTPSVPFGGSRDPGDKTHSQLCTVGTSTLTANHGPWMFQTIQLQTLHPNFPLEPPKCLKNSTLSVSKHLPRPPLAQSSSTQVPFQAAQPDLWFRKILSAGAHRLPKGNGVRERNPRLSALHPDGSCSQGGCAVLSTSPAGGHTLRPHLLQEASTWGGSVAAGSL